MDNLRSRYNYKFIWLISLVAAMGGFLFGYDWVVVGGAKPFYEPYFNVTSPAEQGWGTSSALVGCMFGALLCFFRSDVWGRKRLLILSGFLFAFSSLATALADSFFFYNMWRIVGGIAIGIALNLSPMYISEMAPPHLRGKLVSLNQLLIMIGVLSAQIVNWKISLIDTSMPANATVEAIRASWNGQYGWRWMFGVTAIPSMFFFIVMFFMPESARWLVKRGRIDEARMVLSKIGSDQYASDEITSIRDSLSRESESNSDFGKLFDRRLFRVLLLGIFLAVLQQWCGLNVVFYYAADIFQAAGYNIHQMMLNIVVIGAIMVMSTLVTIFVVERLGRRLLMLSGTAGIAIGYGLIGYCFSNDIKGLAIVVLTLMNVALYSLTLAPIVWVILSEIFPNRVRGAAMSFAATALWIGNFSLTFSFPAIKENLGWAHNFWLYGVICAIGFIVLWFVLPETKGKSLEQIEVEFGTNDNGSR